MRSTWTLPSLAPLSLAAVLVAAAGCNEPEPAAGPRPVEMVEIRPVAPEIFAGQRVHLTALPTDERGEDLVGRPTVWSSSDQEVATVSEFGLVEAMGPGEAWVIAAVEGVEGRVLISVEPVPLGRVEIEPRTVRVAAGEGAQLTAAALDVWGVAIEAAELSWRSLDEAVATVEAGWVVGVAEGTTSVIASLDGVEGSASVRVLAARIVRLIADERRLSIYTGRSHQLEVRAIGVNDEEIPEAALNWRSSNPSIANVDQEGVLRAWSPGSATITASAGDIEEEIEVTVERMPILGITLEPEEVTAHMGETISLVAEVIGIDSLPVLGETLEWSSSDEGLATVDEAGAVALLQPGEVEIIAAAGGVQGKAAIAIWRTPPITRVAVGVTSLAMLRGASHQLEARVFAEDGEVVDHPLVFRSTNPDVASVDETGLVVAHQGGQAELTVAADGVSAKILVYAYELPAEVRIRGDHSDFIRGERRLWRAEVYDQRGALTNIFPVEFSSSDESVATVTGATVHALAPGEATITARAEGVEAQLEVRVVDLEWTKLQAVGDSTCGLTTEGTFYCWGRHRLFSSLEPFRYLGDESYAAFGMGGGHICALDLEGRASCAGLNDVGQLGDGTTQSWTEPVPVGGGHSFLSIAAGRQKSCGVAKGGGLFCWGEGALLPALVDVELEATAVVISDDGTSPIIASLSSSSVCTLGADHGAHCWGPNQSGEVGDGTLIARTAPVEVAGGHSFSEISISARSISHQLGIVTYGHGCAVDLEGAAHCWGSNRFGELGTGVESPLELSPQPVLGGHRFRLIRTQASDVTLGTGSLSCGLNLDGEILCWGLNEWVLPSPIPVRSPTPIPNPEGLLFEDFTLGDRHACAIATDRRAYCWGDNTGRLMGVHSEANPVEIPTLVKGQAPDAADGEEGI